MSASELQALAKIAPPTKSAAVRAELIKER
jgi:hypothetical protein